MKIKIFLDANILFSASKSPSAIYSLVFILAAKHQLISSSYAIEEAKRNLENKKPEWLENLKMILEVVIIHDRVAKIPTQLLPDKDQVILAAAVSAKCNFLVTGDKKHFGQYFGETILGVCILSPTGIAKKLL